MYEGVQNSRLRPASVSRPAPPAQRALRDFAMNSGAQAPSLTVPMGLQAKATNLACARNGPRHLALILQGHRQWSLDANLPGVEVLGATAGRLLELIDFCALRSLAKVTVHLFSDDVCLAPAEQNADLLRTALRYVSAGARNMHRNNVHMNVEGDLFRLDKTSISLLTELSRRTEINSGMRLTVAIDRSLASLDTRPPSGNNPKRTHHRSLASLDTRPPSGNNPKRTHPEHNQTRQFIDTVVEPDFVIRTGGPLPAHRTMLWDTSKTALYFTDVAWPDFDARSLQEALDWYGTKSRRVGVQANGS